MGSIYDARILAELEKLNATVAQIKSDLAGVAAWINANGHLIVTCCVIVAGCLLINSFMKKGWLM